MKDGMHKIESLSVTLNNGETVQFTGSGYLQITNAQEKPEHGGMAKVVGKNISANITMRGES
jgi:hypothetical protein